MNTIIRIFNYRFYVKEFLVLFFFYFLIDKIFSWLIVPKTTILLSHERLVSVLVFGFMLYHFLKLKFYERLYIAIFALLVIGLIIQSLFEFDSIFQQPTLYSLLYPGVYALFIKYIISDYEIDLLEFVAKFCFWTYVIFMLIYGRGFSFNLDVIPLDDYGPFSGDGRVIHSAGIYMLIIPFLWYLHQCIFKPVKKKFLIPLLICVIAILIHQHRSVWSCTILSLLIYIWLSARINKNALPKMFNVALNAGVVIGVAFFFVSNMAPSMVDFFAERFGEIFNPSKEGSTGNFRVDQREVYWDLFLQKPIFGWTFEGWEMPNPLVDWWPPKTGQHFHEGYMEMLFYFGIVGFLFKFSPILYLAIKVFQGKKYSEESIILIPFCLSAFLYQFNYVLPQIYWAHLGLCLYYIEKDEMGGRIFSRKKETVLEEAQL